MRANPRFCMLFTGCLLGETVHARNEGDPHYTPAGFFNIHVCNWPGTPRFLTALFSSPCHDQVARMAVFATDGKHVGDLDATRYRAFKTPSGLSKGAFIAHFDLPENALDGWHRAEITLKDGSRSTAQGYVNHHSRAHPTGTQPAPGALDVPVSTEMRWNPIPGAKFYEAFLRDGWTGTAATASGSLTEPRFVPAQDAPQSGGVYVWRPHARDSDGNVALGHFNHGSLSPEMRFTVK